MLTSAAKRSCCLPRPHVIRVAKIIALFAKAPRLAALAATLLCASSAAQTAEPAQPEPSTACTLEPGPIRTVTRILDGETVTLDDGSEVRLIGALAPRAFDADAETGAWPAEAIAVRTLTDLVLGRAVKLAYGGRRTDRYGRQPHPFAAVQVPGPMPATAACMLGDFWIYAG